MARNEDGEYELILGTPQLLSIVFIIMVLMGVVFSLGYFMGRNAAAEPSTAASPPAQQAAEPRTESPGRPSTQAAAPPAAEPAEAAQTKATGTTPVGGSTATDTTSAEPAQPPATAPQPATSGLETKPPAEPSASTAAAAPYPEPPPGLTFLQVAALRRQEAELLVDVLKRKGFSARVAPGPSETLFRVLVGPLEDAEDIARTRKALEEVGFRSAYIRKY